MPPIRGDLMLIAKSCELLKIPDLKRLFLPKRIARRIQSDFLTYFPKTKSGIQFLYRNQIILPNKSRTLDVVGLTDPIEEDLIADLALVNQTTEAVHPIDIAVHQEIVIVSKCPLQRGPEICKGVAE